MEAARSAALRGHDVTLYEMRRELGGQVVMAARAPFREDYTAITSWQDDELQRLGVRPSSSAQRSTPTLSSRRVAGRARAGHRVGAS